MSKTFVGVDIFAVDESGKKVNLPALYQSRDGSGTKREGAMPVVLWRKWMNQSLLTKALKSINSVYCVI